MTQFFDPWLMKPGRKVCEIFAEVPAAGNGIGRFVNRLETFVDGMVWYTWETVLQTRFMFGKQRRDRYPQFPSVLLCIRSCRSTFEYAPCSSTPINEREVLSLLSKQLWEDFSFIFAVFSIFLLLGDFLFSGFVIKSVFGRFCQSMNLPNTLTTCSHFIVSKGSYGDYDYETKDDCFL